MSDIVERYAQTAKRASELGFVMSVAVVPSGSRVLCITDTELRPIGLSTTPVGDIEGTLDDVDAVLALAVAERAYRSRWPR